MLIISKGLITIVIGLLSYAMMPPGPTQTASWSRGKDGWFSARLVPLTYIPRARTNDINAERNPSW